MYVHSLLEYYTIKCHAHCQAKSLYLGNIMGISAVAIIVAIIVLML